MLVCLPDCRAECRGYKGSGRGKAERAQPFEPPDCAALYAERAVTVFYAAKYAVNKVDCMSRMVRDVGSNAACYRILTITQVGTAHLHEHHVLMHLVTPNLRSQPQKTNRSQFFHMSLMAVLSSSDNHSTTCCVHVHTEVVRYTETTRWTNRVLEL